MVMLTDRAKVALKSALVRSIDEEGVGLRLDVSEEGGLALYPDQAKAGDQVIEHEGNVLLLIGDDLSQPLTGATIDLAETSEGTGLVIMKPQTSQDGRH
jgi:Fe-S cluster assembly iron-binding protein IscA